jgi:hypothetical protein
MSQGKNWSTAPIRARDKGMLKDLSEYLDVPMSEILSVVIEEEYDKLMEKDKPETKVTVHADNQWQRAEAEADSKFQL